MDNEADKKIIQNKINKYNALCWISYVLLGMFLILSIIGLCAGNSLSVLKYFLIAVFINIVVTVLLQSERDSYIRKLQNIDLGDSGTKKQNKITIAISNVDKVDSEVKCKYCGGVYSGDTKKCPHCGSAKQ